ncbi:CAP domain-containing protein [Candidatus Parcubacteria bacterium]|nr:CAP domain-containing protein [Candidatus Parcubacteria bacterium]
MKKILIVCVVTIVAALGLYAVFPAVYNKISVFVKSARELTTEREESVTGLREELFPGPLTAETESEDARLNRRSVITTTNSQRLAAGLKALTENQQLNLAAEHKLDDMFAKQYFEHLSPEGRGPGAVIEESGYRYIVVGENLAMGNFKDEEALVAAWMASPGHKANILHTRFTEIGIAVKEGTYKGRKTWLAVQEFGLPASFCPSVNQTLKARIDADTVRADDMSLELIGLQKALRTMPRETASEEEEYKKEVDYYNNLVTRYNKLVAELKADIDEYNHDVRVYNNCIES